MNKAEKILKKFFMIFTIPAIIGLFLCLKYYGWLSFKVGIFGSTIIPCLLFGSTMQPQQNATRYTYRKDNSKLFGRGELLSQEPMVDNKRLSKAQKEHKQYIKGLGGEKKIFIDWFLIPYLICLIVFFVLLGWISFFRRLFI